MKNKRFLTGLASFMAICMMVVTLSVTAFANAPAPEYRGFPEGVKYNSAGVPILGRDIPANGLNRHSPDDGTYTINGYDIPLTEYPVGSIWDGSGTCVGFARYVYNKVWETKKDATTFSKKTSSEKMARKVIMDLEIGTRITGFKNNAQKHTMIVVDNTDADYVVVYHANYSTKKNRVTMTQFTYKEFYKLFDSIKGVNPPA